MSTWKYAARPDAGPSFDFDTTFSKLLANVRPLAYRIKLAPDVQKLASAHAKENVDFRGTVEISIEIIRPTNTITLNVDGLEFGPEGVSLDGTKAKAVVADKRIVTLVFPKKLGTGRHNLTIVYSGTISSTPQGIYYSDYKSANDAQEHRMLVTQFEPTDARRMFPSWDEPAFKATFTLTIELPSSFEAVSNMPGQSRGVTGKNAKEWTFRTTPSMSSYLVVLVAGELKRIDAPQVSERLDVDIGVVAAGGREEQGRYALEVMGRVLPYYNNYFGVMYPLPKLDLIAIPDFAFLAMENWGGITYIDNVLLFDERVSTHKTREGIFETVAHEVAHQWSGNLVTMAWWDELWLNEGFAAWMQKKATDKLNESWSIRLRAHEEKQSAMTLDALSVSKEIQHDILDDSEADSAFDSITYQKGAAVVRMIEDYVGENVFRDGMRLYMRSHQYSNATTTDLWKALQEASGKDVASVAAGFVTQPGMPLIRLEQKYVNGATEVTLTQEPFSIHGPASDTRLWRVPVRIGRPGEAESEVVELEGKTKTVQLKGPDRPIKANFGDVGYYRMLYDKSVQQELGRRFRDFRPEDRLSFLADTWATVQAGFTEPENYLDLVHQLNQDEHFAIWTRVIATLREIDALEHDSKKAREKFRKYARGLIRPVFDRLGWEPAPDEEARAPLDLLLRALVITALGRFDDERVIPAAQQRFDAGPMTLHKELREPVAVVVGYGGEHFDTMRDLGKGAADTETKLMYYYALAGAGTPDLIPKILEIALSNELPRGRIDRFLGVAAVAGDHPDEIWRAVFDQREELFKKLSAGQRQKLLPEVAIASCNCAVADELKGWADQPETPPGAVYEASRAIEQIRFKAEFKDRLLPKLDAWIERHP